MNCRHWIIGICVGLAVVGLWFMVLRKPEKAEQKNGMYTIGILQTASHPALDAARQGFMDEIKATAGDKINFVIQNGQGSVATIHTIAQQFHAKQDIDGVFAIATPAAQAIVSVEQEKPICIAAVSLTPATQVFLSEKNICGVSDMIDVRAEVNAMKALLPHAQTVGILFSTGEINAVSMAEVMVQEVEKSGLTPVMIGVTSEADIESALMSALRKVDVVLAPTDNMVANAIALIADIMQKAGKPLIVSDNMLVNYGALMARGVDYYESGKQAGKMALQVLMYGKKPHNFSIVKANTKDIVVNKSIAELLGIVIPNSIKRGVVLV